MTTLVKLWTGREICALRNAMRLSQHAFAAKLGVSERMVSRWDERGENIQPQPVNQEALDTVLSLADADVKLRFTQILEGLADQASAAKPAAAPARAPKLGAQSASHLTAMTPGPSLVPAVEQLERQVEMAARRAMRFSLMVEGSNVGSETLDQLRDEVTRLALAYPQQPLSMLLGDLIELQDAAFRLLEGRQRPVETAELYLMAGVLSGMLAKASHDLGDPRSAMTQARAGYVCADNAHHEGLRAWTRGLQSMIAYWAGWPNDAIRYAQLGAEAAAGTRGTSAVWLAAQEARAWAVLGDAEQTEAALNRANDARGQTTGDELDELGGIMTFTRPRQLYYEADTRVWLPGADHAAEASANAAVAAYNEADPSERSFSDEAGSRTNLALARVNAGDLEGGVDALRSVIDLPVGQRIGGIISSVQRVHEALRAPDYGNTSIARTAQQEIEAFCQIPAAAALPTGR